MKLERIDGRSRLAKIVRCTHKDDEGHLTLEPVEGVNEFKCTQCNIQMNMAEIPMEQLEEAISVYRNMINQLKVYNSVTENKEVLHHLGELLEQVEELDYVYNDVVDFEGSRSVAKEKFIERKKSRYGGLSYLGKSKDKNRA